ncbi:MAG: hypothetical protein K2M07_07285 [Muribaculaceae bacterium]|nr:hypothetical protein [Muribaculaceae bacterium]
MQGSFFTNAILSQAVMTHLSFK